MPHVQNRDQLLKINEGYEQFDNYDTQMSSQFPIPHAQTFHNTFHKVKN